jgi:hypothetical protein
MVGVEANARNAGAGARLRGRGEPAPCAVIQKPEHEDPGLHV